MIVKTNTLDYALTAILLIMIEEKEVYLVVFYSCTFKTAEINYDIHNKELPDYKNLKYLSTTKILSCCQVRWLEFLFQFYLIICFHLGCLGSKLNTIIWKEDLYPKEESTTYSSVNPQNLYPIFTYNQLMMSLWATVLVSSSLQTITIVDLNSLHDNILSTITQDETLQEHYYPAKH